MRLTDNTARAIAATTKTTGRRIPRTAAVTAATFVIGTSAAILAPTAAAAPVVTNCGKNQYVVRIDTVPAAGPDFTISVTPTDAARNAGGKREVTVSMWHQIQGCVPGLYDRLADSIWQQLECHQMYPWEDFLGLGGTGPTYDLETWRSPLLNPGAGPYAASHCLNRTSPNGPENGRAGLGTNFPGYLDTPGTGNIG